MRHHQDKSDINNELHGELKKCLEINKDNPMKCINPVKYEYEQDINLGHPRKTRAADDASEMIIGYTQNIEPDENGVCSCPICPKGIIYS